MKNNDIKKAFDKVTLSEEKKNLITNSIIQKREVRTGKKITITRWKQALQVCLLVVLVVMIAVTPVFLKPLLADNGQNNQAGLTEGSEPEQSTDVNSDDNSQKPEPPEDAPEVILDSEIPDEITYEYIVDKMTDDYIYYSSLSGIMEFNYPNKIPKQLSTKLIQHNSLTSEYYEGSVDQLGGDKELYSDGRKSVAYSNANKTFRVYDFSLINIKDTSEYASFQDSFGGITWLRFPKILKEAYRDYNSEISITKYLDRDCAVLTKSISAMFDPQKGTENKTVYFYVDILTGVILRYETKNEAGEVLESIKFTEVRFNEDLRIKTAADEGDKYNNYREVMVIRTEEGNKATATQTIGNLQITMTTNPYRITRGDKVTIQTTVKNVGSEPVTLYASTTGFGIQGSVYLAAYANGQEVNFGRVAETNEVDDAIYTEELQPGESFSREDVFYTAITEAEFDGLFEVRIIIGILDNDEFKTETAVAELNYTSGISRDRYDYSLRNAAESFNADDNLKNIILFELNNDAVIYVSIDFPSNDVKSQTLSTWEQVDLSKNTDNDSPSVIVGLTRSTIVDALINNFAYKMSFHSK